MMLLINWLLLHQLLRSEFVSCLGTQGHPVPATNWYSSFVLISFPMRSSTLWFPAEARTAMFDSHLERHHIGIKIGFISSGSVNKIEHYRGQSLARDSLTKQFQHLQGRGLYFEIEKKANLSKVIFQTLEWLSHDFRNVLCQLWCTK